RSGRWMCRLLQRQSGAQMGYLGRPALGWSTKGAVKSVAARVCTMVVLFERLFRRVAQARFFRGVLILPVLGNRIDTFRVYVETTRTIAAHVKQTRDRLNACADVVICRLYPCRQ